MIPLIFLEKKNYAIIRALSCIAGIYVLTLLLLEDQEQFVERVIIHLIHGGGKGFSLSEIVEIVE